MKVFLPFILLFSRFALLCFAKIGGISEEQNESLSAIHFALLSICTIFARKFLKTIMGVVSHGEVLQDFHDGAIHTQ